MSNDWLECFHFFLVDAFSSTPTLGTSTYTKQGTLKFEVDDFPNFPFVGIYMLVTSLAGKIWTNRHLKEPHLPPFVESSPSPGYPYGFGSKSSPKLVPLGSPRPWAFSKASRVGKEMGPPKISGKFRLVVATQRFFMFIPKIGEMIQFDSYFCKWVETTN